MSNKFYSWVRHPRLIAFVVAVIALLIMIGLGWQLSTTYEQFLMANQVADLADELLFFRMSVILIALPLAGIIYLIFNQQARLTHAVQLRTRELADANAQLERDIAERQRTAQALRESEEHYKSLFENNHAVMLLVDPDSSAIMDANPAACAYYGWTREELKTKKINEINTLSPEQVYAEMQLARTERRNHFFFKHCRADGTSRDVEVYSGPIQMEGHVLLYSIVHDIADRKQAEAALRASEERLRTFYENTSMGIYRTTPDGHIIMVNPALLKMLGYDSFAELANRNLETEGYEPTYDRQRFKDRMEHDGQIMGHEVQWLRRDGSRFWVSESAKAIRDEQGNILYYDGTVEYIADRKQAEAALRASEERYRRLFDRMLDGFALHEIICDAEGKPIDYRFLEVNPAFEVLTSLRAADLIGRTVREVLPEIEPYWIETYGRVALTGEPAHFENYSHDLGKHYEVTAYCPRPGQFAVIFVDITVRRRAEEELSKFKLGIDRSTAAIFITRTDGQIVYVNPAFEDVYGYSSQEAIGQTPRILKSGVIPQERYVEFWRALLNKQVVVSEIINKTKDGRLIPIEGSSNPILDAAGDIIGFLAIHHDITERKQAEQKIAQLSRLYITLSNVNQVIVRTRDRETLFREACRILVDDGHFRMAWISLIDPASQRVQLIAHAGHEAGYLDHITTLIDDQADLYGLSSLDIREGRYVICNDIATDPSVAHWREPALARGYRSSATFPLRVGTRLIGMLGLYAAEPYCFDDDEIRLLQELSGDISFACESIEHERQRAHAEAEAAWLASFPRMNPTPVLEIDLNGEIRYANPAALALMPDLPALGFEHPWLHGLQSVFAEWQANEHGMHGRGLLIGDEWYWQALFYIPGTRRVRIYSVNVSELKQAEASLHKYAQRLETLHRIDRAILVAQSPHDTAAKALSHLRRLVSCQRASVAMFDYTAHEATVLAVYTDGATRWRKDDDFPLTEQLLALLRTNEVTVYGDIAMLPDTAPGIQALRAEGIRAYILIALSVGPNLIGAMNLGSTEPNAFSHEQLEIAREVALQLAIAIHQSQLREQIQRHTDELEQRVADRTRELAEANERLQGLDRLKSQFVSEVSHELRTPITSLKLYLDLLEHGRPEKRARYLASLKEQAARMTQLIEDILDLSRLERDQATMVFAPVDVNDVIEKVILAQQPRAESIGLQLTFEPDANLPEVSGDVNRLAQVFTNLIANALNYTPRGEVRVTSQIADDGVRVAVRDTGMGIDPEDLPHLFDRFYRGQRASRSDVRGTGLGLSIVKDIVELHGGQVEVESTVDVGSTFCVRLPAIP